MPSSFAEAAVEQASLVFRFLVLAPYLGWNRREHPDVGQMYHEPYLFVEAHVLHVDGYFHFYLAHDFVC